MFKKRLRKLVKKCQKLNSKKAIAATLGLFSMASVPVSGFWGVDENIALDAGDQLPISSVLEDYVVSAQLRIENKNNSGDNLTVVNQSALVSLAKTDNPGETSLVKQKQRIPLNLKRGFVPTTAYSSTVDQTDSTPFITANGTRVYDGTIAANFLPFGTKVKFPEYSGDKIYTVEDRMNSRYNYKIDIWFPARKEALQFGKRNLYYEIVE